MSWWKYGVVYQIYPRSYQDSNGDGIGDLQGILSRVDYLAELGVDAIWLSPIYPSPMHDFGYDVADYCDIHPMFGDLDDFDALLAAVHARGMKLILDLVPNHSSEEHEWFVESRSSRDNPKRDWYIWKDAKPDGSPPNNWRSFFGGPAWTWDEQTGQYYLHQFVTQQPELNYRHPEVLPAMLDNMRFWLDRGIDGFRVDVIWLMIKDEQFRDEPINPDWDGIDPFWELDHVYTQDVEGIHDIVKTMRRTLDEYPDKVMIGELYLPFETLVTYYGDDDECHLPFNFHLIFRGEWQAGSIQKIVDDYEASLPENGWPNYVLGNHDQHRIATRAGADQARVAMMLLLTLRGSPTMYYGDELGMPDGEIPLDRVVDPPAVNQPEIAHIVGRDPERTPMQWDDSENAGFSEEEPWLPVGSTYKHLNVEVQSAEPPSMLNFTKQLLTLRKEHDALNRGSYAPVDAPDNVYAYVREHEGEKVLIVLNFSAEPRTVSLDGAAKVILSTVMDGERTVEGGVDVRPNEGVVLKL